MVEFVEVHQLAGKHGALVPCRRYARAMAGAAFYTHGVAFSRRWWRTPRSAVPLPRFDAIRVPEVMFWSIWDGDDLAGCGALIELDSTLLEVDLVDSTDQDHVRLAGGVDPRDVPSRADNLGNKRCASFVGIGLVLARFRVTLQKVENVLNPICRCRIATMQTGEDVLRLGIASNLVHCPRSTI